jgi:quinolinate synthase
MADMVDGAGLRALKAQHPGAVVVTYVNSTAEVKAESDICCTSANAVRVAASLGEKEIIFAPDRNLGAYVEAQTGRKMILWNGYCPTHARILPEHIKAAKEEHPLAKVLVHPECSPAVTALADKVMSTTGMINYVSASDGVEFIIGTELGILHRMKKENPGKLFYPVSLNMLCPNMKKNTLEKVLAALLNMNNRIVVEEPVRSKAKLAIDRMLAL